MARSHPLRTPPHRGEKLNPNAAEAARLAPSTLLRAYWRLHRVARSCLRERPGSHAIQVPELVHDAYVSLAGESRYRHDEPERFFADAKRKMRQLLARSDDREDAGILSEQSEISRQGALDATPNEILDSGGIRDLALLDLDNAMARLRDLNAPQARIVELRFFEGLTILEAAAATGTSHATVERRWKNARAWLNAELANSFETFSSGWDADSTDR